MDGKPRLKSPEEMRKAQRSITRPTPRRQIATDNEDVLISDRLMDASSLLDAMYTKAVQAYTDEHGAIMSSDDRIEVYNMVWDALSAMNHISKTAKMLLIERIWEEGIISGSKRYDSIWEWLQERLESYEHGYALSIVSETRAILMALPHLRKRYGDEMAKKIFVEQAKARGISPLLRLAAKLHNEGRHDEAEEAYDEFSRLMSLRFTHAEAVRLKKEFMDQHRAGVSSQRKGTTSAYRVYTGKRQAVFLIVSDHVPTIASIHRKFDPDETDIAALLSAILEIAPKATIDFFKNNIAIALSGNSVL